MTKDEESKAWWENKGYDSETGLYKTRYYAQKAAWGDEVVTKVYGGYKIMKVTDYILWKKQR